jgi:hypothetical protein
VRSMDAALGPLRLIVVVRSGSRRGRAPGEIYGRCVWAPALGHRRGRFPVDSPRFMADGREDLSGLGWVNTP